MRNHPKSESQSTRHKWHRDSLDIHRDLESFLEQCRRVAHQSFADAKPIAEKIQIALDGFDSALEKAEKHYATMTDNHDEAIRKALEPLVIKKRGEIQSRFEDLVESQQARHDKLDKFTVMFFGKTMAGKSTTIEALTAGNGETIGDGGPDFTRAIDGFDWGSLVLVDTPGLLGFRKDLKGIADAYVSRADLICMVISDDSIEPDLFQRMKSVRGQSKRLLVLLNVKAANNPILNHEPEAAYNEREINEFVEDIRNRLAEAFPDGQIGIVPYCANPAFLAGQTEDKAESSYLWKQSRIGAVIDAIAGIVRQAGLSVRATSAFDALVHYTQSLADELETEILQLQAQWRELLKKRQQASLLFDRIRRDSASELAILETHFHSVDNDLHELAWEFIRGDRTESVSRAFNRTCRWKEVDQFALTFQRGVIERTRRNIEQFQESMSEDLSAAVWEANRGQLEMDSYSDVDIDVGNTKRKIGKVLKVVGAPVASLVAMTVAGEKIGTAVGGVLGGPAGAIIGFIGGALVGALVGWATSAIGGWIQEEAFDDQRGAQRNLRERMKDQLWTRYRSINEHLLEWMTACVSDAEARVSKVLQEYEGVVGTLYKSGRQLAGQLHDSRHVASKHAFRTLLHEIHPAFRRGQAELVDATQWMQYRAKLLIRAPGGEPIAGLVIGKQGRGIAPIREHAGIPIDIIELGANGITSEVIAASLYPARVNPEWIRIGKTTRISINGKQRRLALGRGGRNLQLASELLSISFNLYTSGKGSNM